MLPGRCKASRGSLAPPVSHDAWAIVERFDMTKLLFPSSFTHLERLETFRPPFDLRGSRLVDRRSDSSWFNYLLRTGTMHPTCQYDDSISAGRIRPHAYIAPDLVTRSRHTQKVSAATIGLRSGSSQFARLALGVTKEGRMATRRLGRGVLGGHWGEQIHSGKLLIRT